MNYKLNSEKIRQVLSDRNSEISGIEKHLIQEGLKQITLGTGPIQIEVPGMGYISQITPSLERYLIDAGVISKDEESKYLAAIDKFSSINLEIHGNDESLEFDSWDYKGDSNNPNFFGTKKDWVQTLLTRINKLSRAYLKKERQRYNVIITSPDLGGLFENIDYFHTEYDNLYDKKKGMEHIGNLSNKFIIIVDFDLDDNVMILAQLDKLHTKDSSTWPKASEIEQTPENTFYIENADF